MSKDTSFLDIMSVNDSLFKRHKRSVVLGDYSASDHSYVLHEFKGLIMPGREDVLDIQRRT